tara:strand:+ start:10105 stop:10716 length:612 start_codon:yes stop_codon:yes gene_type:complete
MQKIVAIEGNIGAGKTTLLDYIKGYKLKEPVDQWCVDFNGCHINLLDKYYDNPVKYAFLFQQKCMETKINQLKKIPEFGTIVLDRSIGANLLFAKVQHKLKCLDDIEMATYADMFYRAKKELPPVQYYIYLKTPVEECLKRIKKRGRECEQGITKEYLELLEHEHNDWLCKKDNVIILDGSKDIFDKASRNILLMAIAAFVKK